MTAESILTTLIADVTAACTKAKTALASTAPSGITDRQSRPKPPLPTLGPAGFTFVDPVFVSKILRVTDEQTGGGSTSWRTSSGSDRIWNADGSRFFIENSGGGSRLFAFDSQAVTAKILTTDIPLAGPTWHQTNPLMMIGRDPGERPAVAQMNALTGDRTIVFDVLTKIPEIASRDRTYLRGITQAGGALSFICGGTGQDRDDFAVYLPAVGEPRILNTKTHPQLGVFCHACAMDLSGRYVVLGATQGDINAGKAPNYVWDTSSGMITGMRSSPGGHGALGFGVSVNAPDDIDSQEYRWRHLSDPNTTRLVIPDLPQPPQFFAASHLSWNHARPDGTAPFIVGTYRYGAGVPITSAQPWRPWDDEILSVSVDGKTIRRHCHHRSDVRHDTLPATHVGYWATPRPRTSPDGKWVLYTSNHEKSLGADPSGAGDGSAWRQDTFLCRLVEV